MTKVESIMKDINWYIKEMDPKFIVGLYYFSRKLYLASAKKEQVQ